MMSVRLQHLRFWIPQKICGLYTLLKKYLDVIILDLIITYHYIDASDGGDFACNARRGLTALMSMKDKIFYHLFDYNSLQMVQVRKWQNYLKSNLLVMLSLDLTNLDEIVSLDFNHSGKMIVAIDQKGNVLVTEVDANGAPVFNEKFDSSKIYCAR